MKSKQKQREKLEMKSKPANSIGASSTSKILNVSDKSQAIQRKLRTSTRTVQSTLIPVKNQNESKLSSISKCETLVQVNTESATKKSLRRKQNLQVESKVSEVSPFLISSKINSSNQIHLISFAGDR